MLSRHLRMVDLDGRHLANWLRLLLPPGLGQARWAALFVDADRRVVHAVRGDHGRIDPSDAALAGVAPAQLTAARRRLAVDLLAVLEVGALGRLHADVERRLSLDDAYPAQGLTALRALRQLDRAGLWLDPPLLELVPPLSPEALARTFELLVPDGSALLAYAFDERPADLHASVIAVVERREIALVTTHRGLEGALPGAALARNWRGQIDRLHRLVEERYAAPSIGLFFERSAWQRILVGPAEQMTREMAAGNLVIDPAPTWLRGLLGGAQLAAFATRRARSLARFVPSSARRAASGLAQSAQDRLKSAGAHPFALLGFDPVEVWHRLRAYYRPASSSTDPPTTR